MIQLTKEAKRMIGERKGMRIRNRLALEMDKSTSTIERWLTDNDEMLTTALAVKIISEETGLSANQILTEHTEAA